MCPAKYSHKIKFAKKYKIKMKYGLFNVHVGFFRNVNPRKVTF